MKPQTPILAIDNVVEQVAQAIPEARERIDTYNEAAVFHEEAVSAQVTAETADVEGAGKKSLDSLRKAGEKHQAARRELQAQRVLRCWAKRDLCESLVPLFTEHAEKMQQMLRAETTALREQFASMGIDEYSIDEGWMNPQAANDTIERRISNEFSILVAKANANRSRHALELVKHHAQALPNETSATIKWPTYENKQATEALGL